MLNKEWLEIRAIEKRQLLIKRAEEEIIKKLEIKNDKIVKTVKEIKKAGVRILRNNK